jgi:hypothetical protein
MSSIDIANPGDKLPELRSAFAPIVAPTPMELTWTGVFTRQFNVFAVTPGVMSFFPANLHIAIPGCWVQNISFEEDTSEGVTTLSFPNLGGVIGDFSLEDFHSLISLNAPELTVVGDELGFYNFDVCTSISIPKLKAVAEYFQVEDLPALTSFSAPELEYTYSINMYNNSGMESVNFPKLELVRSLNIWDCDILAELSTPKLKEITEYLELGYNGLTSLSFPELERIGYVGLSWGTESITHFSYGNNLKYARNDQRFDGCSLVQESVDGILQALANLDGTNGTTEFRDYAVILYNSNSSPSQVGLEAAQTLIDRDCNIQINYPDEMSFTLTAGQEDTIVGYVKESVGSVTGFEVFKWLNRLNTNNTDLEFQFQSVHVTDNLISGKTLYVDTVQYDGYWDWTDDTYNYVLNNPEELPTFVNGNTYTIELK